MHPDSQIHVPPSFIALVSDARGRLTAPPAEVADRYELCEDLAQMLVEQAQILYHQSAPSEHAILKTMHMGLQSEGAVVTPPEARWVILRLSELLGWKAPELPLPDAAE